jgi:Cu(I)/Ag(I) efflux system membrane fusion protein
VVADHDHETALEVFLCPMHPNIVSDEPGACPICGMDLQPRKKSTVKGIPGRSPVELTGQQRQLINLRTANIGISPVAKTIRTVGIMEQDDSAVFTVSAWTSGRIEHLYVNKVEMNVRTGDRLYSIYSPDLYSTMQEYVGLLANQPGNSLLIDATETRLALLGLSDEQLKSLRASRRATPAIDVVSPVAGRVTKMTVREGGYVKTGDPMYTISDLSRLWLIVTVYEFELGLIEIGMQVVATTPAYPGDEFKGRITVINHNIARKARAAEIRVDFNLREQASVSHETADHANAFLHQLMPEMYMNVEIAIDLGEQLIVPASAVFGTGERDYVFTEQDDGLFVPKLVDLGTQVGQNFVVLGGLKAGMKVVVDGNFLLDSESQFRAAAEGT